MAEYAAVKGGSLNLKRSKGSSVFKKKKRKKGSEEIEQWMKEPGAVKHGERERESVVFSLYISQENGVRYAQRKK